MADDQRIDTYKRLRTLLAETLGAGEDEISWDTNVYDDLNADVIEFHDEVMQLVEEEFSVIIPDDEVADLTTVRELVDFVVENT
jgi:acyl carrier protein